MMRRQLTTLLHRLNTVDGRSLAVAPKPLRLLVVTVTLCAVPTSGATAAAYGPVNGGKGTCMVALGMLLLGLSIVQTGSAATYDLLLKGGHVIDARNGVTAVRDVAIKDGTIAAVAP